MDYRVKIVSDHALPSTVKRVMVERRGQDPLLVIAESAAVNWEFVQEWERRYGHVMPDLRCLRAV